MTSIADTRVTRCRFGISTGCALASAAFGEACLVATNSQANGDGRLTARPARTSSRRSRAVRWDSAAIAKA
jgi:hypothetical protein